MRLALVYALLDRSACIRREHLEAALALWTYAEASARYIFGDAIGDLVADKILLSLRDRPQGMTRSEIRELFAHHCKSREIDRALDTLRQYDLARFEREETAGRPTERWYATRCAR